MPMAITVRIPFTLEPQAQAMKTPVPTNQPHHSGVNALQGGGQQWLWKGRGLLVIQISQLTEADVGIHSEREEKDKSGVQ